MDVAVGSGVQAGFGVGCQSGPGVGAAPLISGASISGNAACIPVDDDDAVFDPTKGAIVQLDLPPIPKLISAYDGSCFEVNHLINGVIIGARTTANV